jgi:hypothetical protein
VLEQLRQTNGKTDDTIQVEITGGTF